MRHATIVKTYLYTVGVVGFETRTAHHPKTGEPVCRCVDTLALIMEMRARATRGEAELQAIRHGDRAGQARTLPFASHLLIQ